MSKFDMGEKHSVFVTLIFDGEWEFQGSKWEFVGRKISKAMVVDEDIYFNDLRSKIMEKLAIQVQEYELEITYVPPSKENVRPFRIVDDSDLEAYKFLNRQSKQMGWPIELYVTLQKRETDKQTVGIDMTKSVDDMPILSGPDLTQSQLYVDVHEAEAEVNFEFLGSEWGRAYPNIDLSDDVEGDTTQDGLNGVPITHSESVVDVNEVFVSFDVDDDPLFFDGDEVISLTEKENIVRDETRGKEVISVSSDEDGNEAYVFGSSSRVTIDIGSSSEDVDDDGLSTKGEDGDISGEDSFEWCSADEEAVQEIERRFPNTREVNMSMEDISDMVDKAFVEETDPRHNLSTIMVGQFFNSKEEVKTRLQWAAVQKCFEMTVKKSTRSVYVVGCIDPKCIWMCRASKFQKTTLFVIRKYVDEHTCDVNVKHNHHRQATSTLIGQKLVSSFTGSRKNLKPEQIQALMKGQLGVNCSYFKARRARVKARDTLYGTPEESYHGIYSYFHVLEQVNPGTYTRIVRADNDQFKYAFVSFGVWRKAIPLMRKVISVDGTFLKEKYKGTLLIATAQDADHQIYPIAFAIVDSENDASWSFFFREMLNVIPDTNDLMWVSDRHGSIEKGIRNSYVFAKHGICCWHLFQNVKHRHKVGGLQKLFFAMAKAYTLGEFDRLFAEFSSHSAPAGQYLKEAGVRNWARAHFCANRYNINTTNNAETMNSVLNEPRDLPIIALIDFIIERMSKWFWERREASNKWDKSVSKWVAGEIEKNYKQSICMVTRPLSHHEYEIRQGASGWLVNLCTRTCTCKRFDIDQYPCSHAIAATKARGMNMYNLVHELYKVDAWRAAYQDVLYPVPPRDQWRVPVEISSIPCFPPSVKRRPGRPKQKRYPSRGENIHMKRRRT